MRRRAFLVLCVAAIAVKIWLTLSFDMKAADRPVDDRLFVKLAEQIIHGQWLGPYDQYTLCKGPFFPIWIAATFLMHIPLLLSYQLLHAAACGLVVYAFGPVVPARPARLVLLLMLLFDPASFSVTFVSVDRGAIYMPFTMIIIACAAGMMVRLDRGPRAMVGWSLGLGLALAAYWTTREEGVWILPFLGVTLAYALFSIVRARTAVFAKTALTLLPAGICVAGLWGISAINYRYYGAFEVVDLKSPAFKRANGALMRVKAEQWNQYASVPQEVRHKIYAVSPAFAELRGYFEGKSGASWGTMAEKLLSGGTPRPEDIRGGFFMWALRDAVQSRNHYESRAEADAFYNRVADEINAACEDGRLICGPERATLMPPWHPSLFQPALASVRKGVETAVAFPIVAAPGGLSVGAPDRLVIFEDIGRATLRTEKPNDLIPPRLRGQAELDYDRFLMMRRISSVYQAVDSYLTVAAAVALITVCVLELRKRSLTVTVAILLSVLASFWARIAILAVISVTSFEATNQFYILPLYPMLLLFWFLSFHHLARLMVPVFTGRNQRNAGAQG